MDSIAGHKKFVFFLILVTFLLYFPSLFADFVFDDHYLILNNFHLRSAKGIWEGFTRDYYGQVNPQYSLGYYRPISLLTHWTDWQMWKTTALGHHLTSLLIHIAVVVVLFFVILKLFQSTPLAFFAAAIFAVHPSHVNSVTFISGRVDAIATFLSLSALLAFTARKAVSPIFYFLALLAKEISVTTPILIFWKEREKSWRSAFLWMIPFAAVLVIVLVIRHFVLGSIRQLSLGFENIVSGLSLIPAYLRFMVLPPIQLYLEPPISILPIVFTILALVLYCVGLWFVRDNKIRSWSLMWLITLLPVLGFVRIETSLDERFLYFPSVSFCLLFAGCLTKYLQKRNHNEELPSKQIWITAALILLIYSPVLLVRQMYWQNDVSLWSAAAETNPNDSRVLFRLGVAYLQADDFGQAEENFVKALSAPNQDKTITAALYAHLATLKQAKNVSDDVENLYHKALAINPDYYTAHFNLGLFYKKSGQLKKAEQEFREAIRCNYSSPQAHQNLADVLREMGKPEESEKHMRIAKELGTSS
ncbi:MAG TPA: tetratricopeptide repeat protein [Acidobacteriota bacterium]|nr:tetratricopeptide repeat protein [Acidobacteriota bacterium]